MTPREENEAIQSHMPLVYSALKRMSIKGAGFDDALQEGRIAVLMALRSFDPCAGAKLSTWVYSRVSWRLKDWMDTETRIRSGHSFKGRKGGSGNEASDWAPPSPAEKARIVGSGDDLVDLAYPWLADASPGEAPAEPDASGPDSRSQELDWLLGGAIRGLPERLRGAADSLASGHTVKQTATALGVSPRTAWAYRKEAKALLASFRAAILKRMID